MMPTVTDQIQPEEIKATLKASGYLLEGRVGNILESKGFYVELNGFRSDPRDDSKFIEVDVWGRFGETINTENGSSVVAECLIECKNNSQPVVFFMKAQPATEINDRHVKYAGYPPSSADPETRQHIPMHKLLVMKDWHHYCAVEWVATQFCGFSRDSASEESSKQKGTNRKLPLPRVEWRWKTDSMENYSKSFGNLCIVTEGAGVGSFDTDQQNIQLEFYYPIIVFQGPLYEASVHDRDIELRPTEQLQLHHSASVGGHVIRAQIDVVSERQLPGLIETIQNELKQMAEGIKRIEPRLLASAIDQKQVAAQRLAGAAFAARQRGNSSRYFE
jgi:hypothetical protein